MTISLRLVQLAKANQSTCVIESGKVTFCTSVPRNAPSPITITGRPFMVEGTVTSVSCPLYEVIVMRSFSMMYEKGLFVELSCSGLMTSLFWNSRAASLSDGSFISCSDFWI